MSSKNHGSMVQGIILAAGHGRRIRSVAGRDPKAMVSTGGCPLIWRQMIHCRRAGIRRFIVVLRPHHIETVGKQLQTFFMSFGVEVVPVVQEQPLGPGHALATAISHVHDSPVVVFLGDTLVQEPLPWGNDWVAVADVSYGATWCWVEADADGTIQRFWDKVPKPETVHSVACGVYSFSNACALQQACNTVLAAPPVIAGEIQLSAILTAYHAQQPLKAYPISTWSDWGDRKSYHRNFRQFLGHNSFNTLSLDRFGCLTKRADPQKVADVHAWYQSLGKARDPFVPRLFEVHADGASYSIEFHDLPTLAELLYAEDFDTEHWAEVVTDLLQQLAERFWQPIPPVPYPQQLPACLHMYVDKTQTRYQEWSASNPLAHADHIVLNGRRLLSPQEAVARVLLHIERLAPYPRWGFVHGDLNFSNVLYSRRNGHFLLVDPRGRFGDLPAGSGGDLRYEIAKLRHSYHGRFEAFLYDLFVLERHGETSFSLQVPTIAADLVAQLDQVVVSFGFCLEEIQWLEASLFVSMLPLHQGAGERATALFLNALDIITRLTVEERGHRLST